MTLDPKRLHAARLLEIETGLVHYVAPGIMDVTSICGLDISQSGPRGTNGDHSATEDAVTCRACTRIGEWALRATGKRTRQ